LIRRGNDPYKGTLTVPGGKKERGESFIEACSREVREETGLFLDGVRTRGIAHIVQGENGKEVVAVYCDAHGFHGELHPSNEGSLVWVSIDESSKIPGINPFFVKVAPFIFGDTTFFATIFVDERGEIIRDSFVPLGSNGNCGYRQE
jgi:8-oxo-dGTP diphosphatase